MGTEIFYQLTIFWTDSTRSKSIRRLTNFFIMQPLKTLITSLQIRNMILSLLYGIFELGYSVPQCRYFLIICMLR